MLRLNIVSGIYLGLYLLLGLLMQEGGRILTERPKTSGTPDVVSGSSMTVDPLDLIIFLVPSWVQMMPTKFVNVKSVPKMTGRCICLQTMKDWVSGWSLMVKVQVT